MSPEISLITQIAETLYGLKPRSIQSLALQEFAWRGIYRLEEADGRSWVLRMTQRPEALSSYMETAHLLERLAQANYPAPAMQRTLDGQSVGLVDGWAVLMLSFVEGALLGRDPGDLRTLAHTVGRLHRIQKDAQLQTIRRGRPHPETITRTMERLASPAVEFPHEYQPLVRRLHESMTRLAEGRAQGVDDAMCLTHGDCWYMNAIKTSDRQVTLVDWDTAGVGLPVLDLGYLLLTSHFDLSQPLQIAANEDIIRMIMEGYQQERPISPVEAQNLGDAMRFLPAYQVGSYLHDDRVALRPDFPFLLQKLQARTNVVEDILSIAWPLVSSS